MPVCVSWPLFLCKNEIKNTSTTWGTSPGLLSEFAFIRDLGTCAAMLKRSYNDKTELSIEDCLKIRNHISELISNNRPTLVGRRKYLEDLILTNVKINGRALSAIEYSLNAKFSYCKRKCRYIKG